MEVIVIVIAELLPVVLTNAWFAFGFLGLVGLYLIVEFIGFAFGLGAWRTRLRVALLVLIGLGIAFVLLLPSVLLGPALEKATDKLKAEHGLTVEITSSRVDIFSGALDLQGVTLTRASDPGLELELKVKRVSFALDRVALLTGATKLTSLEITDIKGDTRRKGPRGRQPITPAFESAAMVISDVKINTYTPAMTRPRELIVERAVVTPFRSHMALHDALFFTDATGTFDRTDFSSDHTEQGTVWTIGAVSVTPLVDGLSEPSKWLSDGYFSVRADMNSGLTDGEANVEFRVTLTNVRVDTPEGLTGDDKKPVLEAAAQLNKFLEKNDPVMIRFSIPITTGNLGHATSLADTTIVESIEKTFPEALATISVDPEMVAQQQKAEEQEALEKQQKAEEDAKRAELAAEAERIQAAESLKKLKGARAAAAKSAGEPPPKKK